MASDLILTVGFGADEAQLSRVVQAAQNRLNRTNIGGGGNFRATELALGRITGKANEFQKSLEAANARVIAFGSATGAIFVLRAAFSKLVESTVQVEQSLAEINSLLDLNSRDLQNFASNLFRVANQTGAAFANAAKAATEFSRQGLGVEETLRRTSAALTLSRLSGIGLEEAVASLTGVLNSFTKEALNAEDVVNRLAAVDARYAVSSSDLAKALSRVGASANDANVSLNETIALVTAAQQVTARGGSVIGNAFKTIFTRLQRPEVLDSLEQAGVAVTDLNGKTKPLIDILRSLASTYDGLAREQKSFVAETVGGVYQINVLKAVMNDLGSGASIVQGALKVAGDSAGSAEARLKVLNSTISSQLLRTMNDLTQASANVGNALLNSTLRGGLSSFQGLLQKITEATDPTKALEGSFSQQAQANIAQGALKGLGNLIKGPGLQAGVFLLLKLFERLEKFIIDSARDISGLDQQAKNRAELEKKINAYLEEQNEQFVGLISGQRSVNEVARNYLELLKQQNAELKTRESFSGALASVIAPSVNLSGRKITATGFVPNLDPEQRAARANNYIAGSTMQRTIRNGLKSMDVLANSRETISTVKGADGLSYDFINPPQGTSAFNKHRQKSISQTGIDPMSLTRKSMAGGFVPNLALTPDQIEPAIRAFFNKPHQVGQIEALMRSVKKKGYLPDDAKGLRHFLGGVMLSKQAFPGITPQDADKLTQMITGIDIAHRKQEALAAQTTTLNPQDVQSVLSRFGPDFPLIAAYGSAETMAPVQAFQRGYDLTVGQNKFNVPVQVLGHSAGTSYFKSIQEKLKFAGKELGVNSQLSLPASTFGAGFGAIFDETLKTFFAERGAEVGAKNAPIDILGYHPDIAQYIGTKRPFAGAEVKASATEAGSLPGKIFKMLAGDPNSGLLKGPVSRVPPLRNIGLFNNTQGSVGILDWDEFKNKVSRKENDFHSLVYSAIASGKPFKVNYGPMGSGKTTAAKGLADRLGGGFVLGRDDVNNKNIDQFILTTTALSDDTLQKGVFGLAFAASSEIESFIASPKNGKSPVDVLRQRIAERGRDNENPEFLINENKVEKYMKVFDYLKKTYGPLGRYKATTTAGGFVPNLSMGDESLGDIMKGMKSNLHAMLLHREVARQANSFIASNGLDKKVKPIDRDFLAGALTSHVMGKDNSNDRRILNKSSGMSDSYFDVIAEGFANQVNYKELLARVQSGEYAGGFVPNLHAVKDALDRENRATGGRAMLDNHPSLKTADNPFGLAAIDKRQGSAANAIREHLTFQSMSEIKKAGTRAAGHVPNLATSDNLTSSIVLGLLPYGNQIFSTGDKLHQLALKFPALTSQADTEIAKQKELIATFDRLRDELLTGARTVATFRLSTREAAQTFRGVQGAHGLEEAFGTRIGSFRTNVGKYEDAISKSAANLSRLGLRLSIGASVGGGIVSQIAGRFSPTIGAGFESVTTGLTNAGQALLAFPNRIGKSIGAGLFATGLFDAIDTWSKKLENSRRTFELEQSASQKLIARVDTLSATVNNLDSLMNDASVSTGTLTRENRKFIETLGQIRSTPQGAKLAAQIESAPDNRTRLRLLDEFRNLESQRIEKLATSQEVRELAAKRSFDLGGLHASSGTFSFSNPLDKEPLQQSVLGIASTAIAGFTDDFKEKLLASVDSLDAFNKTITSGDKDFNDFLNLIQKTGTKQDREIIVQQVRSLLANQRLQNDPTVARARAALIERNESRQQSLDNAIRRENTTRRLFVNQGALQAGNTLDLRQIATNQAASANSLNLSRRQAASGLFQLQFGELTNRSFNTSTELRRIEGERQNRVSTLSTQTSRSIVEALSQSFDSNLKNAESLKDIGKSDFNSNIGEFKLNLINGLNQGISKTIEGGNLDRFKQGGKFDFEKLEAAITKNSGGSPEVQRQIQGFLQNNRSLELLKTIEGANNELVTINQDALTEAEKQTIALEGFKKELNFKQLSSFLGGIHNLLDRNSRRGLEREAIRGATLLRNGTTPEARAFGAATLLNFFKSQNIPLDLTGKTPLSKLMKDAFEVAGKGLADVQRGSVGRILGSVGRLTGDNAVNSGLRQFANVDFNQTALAALQAEFKPENSQILNNSEQFNNATVLKFNTELNDSVKSVKEFSNALKATKDDLLSAIKNRDAVRSLTSKQTNADVESFQKLLTEVGKKFGDALKGPELTQRTNYAGQVSNAGGLAVGLGASIFQYLAYRKLGQLPGVNPIVEPAKSGVVERGARGQFTAIPNNRFTTYVPENLQPRATIGYSSPIGPQLPRQTGPTSRTVSIPSSRSGGSFTQVQVPIAPEPIAPPYAPGRFGRGFASAGGSVGGIATLLAGQALASKVQNPYLSGAISLGSIPASIFAGNQINKGLLGALPLLRAGGFGIGAGGGALSLGSLGVGGTLGVGALAAGTAYGGFKLGGAIYRGAAGIGGIERALGSDNNTVSSASKVVQQLINKGKSQREIEAFINSQINTAQGQLSNAQGQGGGFSAGVTRLFGTSATGLGGVEKALQETIAQLKQLKDEATVSKAEHDNDAKQAAFQDNLIKVLSKSGGEGGSVQSAIKVDISVKDADKIPELLSSRLIDPLKKQFEDLQSQVNGIQQHLNIAPSPAKI